MDKNTTHCKNCDIRIPKHRPFLICSICSQVKHYKCNFLSKNEAFDIIATGNSNYWSCYDCISTILPINCTKSMPDKKQTLITCTACNKKLPNQYSVTCEWCDRQCHKACLKNSLGCTNCCKNMIPGYYYYAHELTGYFHKNDIFVSLI